MYENVGKKIQMLGKILGWLFLIAGIIAWLVLVTNGDEKRMFTSDDVYGWVVLPVGILGFVFSWFTVGFGILVEKAES